MSAPLTTAQAAASLGVSERRICALIAAGRLRATKFGSAWLIAEPDLAAVATRKNGRPAEQQSTMGGAKQ